MYRKQTSGGSGFCGSRSFGCSAVVIILLAAISAANRSYCAEIELFVSPNGNDINPGTRAQPLKTIEAARDAVREADRNQKRTVWLRAGVYELDKPLVLTRDDSGSPGKPVAYR
ncbi:MAG: hypothetical protein ACYSWO_03200, partial [Planctomycetota bacterium]